MLNIEKTVNDSALTLALSGRLDTVTAPQLEQALKTAPEGVTELILDFEQLDYISSAGLRVLLMAQKTMSRQDGMKLRHVKAEIQEIFEVTGFSDILTIE